MIRVNPVSIPVPDFLQNEVLPHGMEKIQRLGPAPFSADAILLVPDGRLMLLPAGPPARLEYGSPTGKKSKEVCSRAPVKPGRAGGQATMPGNPLPCREEQRYPIEFEPQE